VPSVATRVLDVRNRGGAVLPLALALAVAHGSARAQEFAGVRVPEAVVVGGYVLEGPTIDHEFAPHPKPRALPRATTAELAANGNAAAAAEAGDYLRRYPETVALMLLERGRIVFQAYQRPGGAERELYGMSISKSMTGLAVGKALCAGAIASLDRTAGSIVPELNRNNYGRSTLRQLLTMSSGAYVGVNGSQPKFETARFGRYAAAEWPMRLGMVSVDEVLWGWAWDSVAGKNPHRPGEVFVYKAGDTLALGQVVQRATGMPLAAWWDKSVWREVRGAHTGHWEADRDGSTLAALGLQLHLDDWARVAVWILEERARPGCFGEYLRAATSPQIANARLTRAGVVFESYGYQWWTQNRLAPGFWGLGYAGQFLGIDPDSGKLLIRFGYAVYGRVGRDLFELFERWAKRTVR